MQDFEVIRKDGTVFLLNNTFPYRAVTAASRAPRWQEIEKLSITVRSSTTIDFKVGDRMIIRGRPYEIFTPVASTKVSGEFSGIEYVIPFFSPEKHFETTDFFATDENLTYVEGFGEEPPMVGNLEYYGKVLCNNVERNKGRKIFKLGDVPAGTDEQYRYVEFTDYNCMACLTQICEEFKTFFTIRPNLEGDSDYLLDFGREVGTFPATLSQGLDNGLYTLENTAIDDKGVVTKLLVLGSDKNLPQEYPYPRLRLPDRYQGSIITDPAKVEKWGAVEGRYNSEVHPTRLGEIGEVFENDLLSFIDDTLDFDPTGGKVTMKTGQLTGFNFNITKYDAITHRITIAELKDSNNLVLPSLTYIFGVGDKYHIIDFSMPQSYHTAAREALAADGEDYFSKVSQPQATYRATFEKFYLKELGVIPELGMMIPINDNRTGIDKHIRLTAYSQDLLLDEYDFGSTEISDIKTESLYVKLYKATVRSADKLKYAGFNDPSTGPTSSFAAAQNSLAQAFGYWTWAKMIEAQGKGKTVIDPEFDLIRASMIDVDSLSANTIFGHQLAANIALIASLVVKSIKTDVYNGYWAELLNKENILKFQKEISAGVPNPNKYVKIGYSAELVDGQNLQPQVWMMSDDADGVAPGDISTASLQPNAIGIGRKLTNTSMEPYVFWGMSYDGSQRRAVGLLKNMYSAPIAPSGMSGFVWVGSVQHSLYVIP